MLGWLKPQDSVSDADVDRGLRMLLYDGLTVQVMGVLTGGAFLVAFALMLGASNKVIGLLAAVGPFSQLLQIPAIYLTDRIRMRKLLTVTAAVMSRVFWFVIAAIPWFLPEELRIPVFLAALFAHFGFGAVAGCAFNSWIRDFVPESIMGSYFGRRMAMMTALGAALSLVGGVGVDQYRQHVGTEQGAYTILFVVGAVFGLLATFYMARVPEPRMVPASDKGLLKVLAEPFRDQNFRQLIKFLGIWNFAVNLAAPFFTVYMLKRLGLSMSWVLGLAVVSQLVNVLFFRIWGGLADRFTNKSVLAASGPLFMLSILIWPFTTMPDRHFLTIPLLVVIHALAGVSTAGVAIASGNLALKAAPRGRATAYLATNALVSGVAATIAPILAGFTADWFETQEVSLTFRWASTAAESHDFQMSAINLRGLDFLFLMAFGLGLYAVHRQLAVREAGEVEDGVVLQHLYVEVRKSVRHVSTVAGLRHLTHFPFIRIKEALNRLLD